MGGMKTTIPASKVRAGDTILSEGEEREVVRAERVGSRVQITVRLASGGTLTWSERPSASMILIVS